MATRCYLLLLLPTGARLSEARLMRWRDLDEPSRLWQKPHTKNGSSHVIPLPVQALSALQQLPRTSEWVFPGTMGRPWSIASVHKTWAVIRRRWGLDDVRIYDLRRTCASYLAISGENLLNTNAVDRALQAQADQLCNLMQKTIPEESTRGDDTRCTGAGGLLDYRP